MNFCGKRAHLTLIHLSRAENFQLGQIFEKNKNKKWQRFTLRVADSAQFKF
jgi:hypothetical protein